MTRSSHIAVITGRFVDLEKEAKIDTKINAFSGFSAINVLGGNAFRLKKDHREKAASEASAKELLQRPCCGSGCTNCPYEPRHVAGNTHTGSVVKNADLREARNETHIDPTPAQAHAGNYKKGEFTFHGLRIKIENPKGTERRGYDKRGAIKWRRMMHADYGYFKGTKAVDGDAVDVFVGSDQDSEMIVAIDQYKGDEFDETKFVVGVKTQEQGEKLYLRHYPRGWKLGPVSTTTVPQLRKWLKSGKTMEPFKGQQIEAA